MLSVVKETIQHELREMNGRHYQINLYKKETKNKTFFPFFFLSKMFCLNSISNFIFLIKCRFKGLNPKHQSKITEFKTRPRNSCKSNGYPETYLARQKYPPGANIPVFASSQSQASSDRQNFPPPMTKCRQWAHRSRSTPPQRVEKTSYSLNHPRNHTQLQLEHIEAHLERLEAQTPLV
ncbi:unnamed protein product [Rhizopus stolonifer]